MIIDENILYECVCYLCDYKFGSIRNYQIRDGWILVTVQSDPIREYFVGTKNVDIDFDEYINFVRNKKLNMINKKLHT